MRIALAFVAASALVGASCSTSSSSSCDRAACDTAASPARNATIASGIHGFVAYETDACGNGCCPCSAGNDQLVIWKITSLVTSADAANAVFANQPPLARIDVSGAYERALDAATYLVCARETCVGLTIGVNEVFTVNVKAGAVGPFGIVAFAPDGSSLRSNVFAAWPPPPHALWLFADDGTAFQGDGTIVILFDGQTTTASLSAYLSGQVDGGSVVWQAQLPADPTALASGSITATSGLVVVGSGTSATIHHGTIALHVAQGGQVDGTATLDTPQSSGHLAGKLAATCSVPLSMLPTPASDAIYGDAPNGTAVVTDSSFATEPCRPFAFLR